jgi:hypothetical protein
VVIASANNPVINPENKIPNKILSRFDLGRKIAMQLIK